MPSWTKVFSLVRDRGKAAPGPYWRIYPFVRPCTREARSRLHELGQMTAIFPRDFSGIFFPARERMESDRSSRCPNQGRHAPTLQPLSQQKNPLRFLIHHPHQHTRGTVQDPMDNNRPQHVVQQPTRSVGVEPEPVPAAGCCCLPASASCPVVGVRDFLSPRDSRSMEYEGVDCPRTRGLCCNWWSCLWVWCHWRLLRVWCHWR